MEITRRFLERYPTRFGAYLALQRALMRHHIARGGTGEDFCQRLAPAFHRRYAPLFLDGTLPPTLSPCGGARDPISTAPPSPLDRAA